MHQMNMWYNLQPETKQCLLIPPELRRARVVFFQHANASEMQTRAGYCRVGVFINSSKRESAWQALQPKGLGHQPIKHPALVHANSRTVLSFRSVIIAACFSPSYAFMRAVRHAAQSWNLAVRIRRLHCSSLLPTPPVRVLDTSSELCYMLCLFTRCCSFFHSRPCATIMFPVFQFYTGFIGLWVHVEWTFAYLCGCILCTVQEMSLRDT